MGTHCVVIGIEKAIYIGDGESMRWEADGKLAHTWLYKEAPSFKQHLENQGYKVEKLDGSDWTYWNKYGNAVGRFLVEELS